MEILELILKAAAMVVLLFLAIGAGIILSGN